MKKLLIILTFLLSIITLAQSLSISSQPSTAVQNVAQNATVTALSVTATGGTTPYTYQWYSNTNNTNTGGTSIDMSTFASYTPSTSTVGTMYYYAVVTDDASTTVKSDVSGAVTVTASVPEVNQGGVGINTESPTASFEIHDKDEANGTSLFKITRGDSNTVIFEIKDDGTTTNINNSNAGRNGEDSLLQKIERMENEANELEVLINKKINTNN